MANVLEIPPAGSPPLPVAPIVPDSGADEIPGDCQRCVASFHYALAADGSPLPPRNDNPTDYGIWITVLDTICGPDIFWPFLNTGPSSRPDGHGSTFATFCAFQTTGAFADFIWHLEGMPPEGKTVNGEPKAKPITMRELAEALFSTRFAILNPAQGMPDAWTVYCADGDWTEVHPPSPGKFPDTGPVLEIPPAGGPTPIEPGGGPDQPQPPNYPPNASICPLGYYYDWSTELCFPWPVQIPPIPPIPPITPPPDQGECPPGYYFWEPGRVCLPNPIPPPHHCRAGYKWDEASQSCVKIPIVPVPPSEPDPQGDEITNTLCAQMRDNTNAILSALSGANGGSITDPACCAQVVAAISRIVTVLGSLTSAVSSAPGTTQIVGALRSIATALGALGGAGSGPAPDLSAIVAALDGIRDKIPATSGTDVSKIVDELKQLVSAADIPESTFDALVQHGYMKPETRAMFQGDWGWDSIQKWWSTWIPDLVEGFLLQFGWDNKLGKPVGKTPNEAAIDGLRQTFSAMVTGNDAVMTPIIETLVDLIKELIAPPSTPAVGKAGIPLGRPIAFATSVALSVSVCAYFLSFLGVHENEALKHVSELFATAIGYEELRDVEIGPIIRNGLAKVADYEAKALFQQELPGANTVFGWEARGLLEPERANEIAELNGLHFSLRDAALKSSYHGLPVRQMIRLSSTGLFTTEEIADELTFSGMRPVSQTRLLHAAPYLATATVRSGFHGVLESAYVFGLLDDNDLTAQWDEAEHDTDRASLVLKRVRLQKRVALAKELESAYTTQFVAGLTDEPTYKSMLSGIGLQDDTVNGLAAIADAKIAAANKRKMDAAEQKLERETIAAERKAALQNFKSGATNAIEYALALIQTGLTQTQTAAWVDLAALQKLGNPTKVFGLSLLPHEATLLRERVTAITDQRKRGLLTDKQFTDQLVAFDIPPHTVNALRAAANAMLTPAKSAILTPVEE